MNEPKFELNLVHHAVGSARNLDTARVLRWRTRRDAALRNSRGNRRPVAWLSSRALRDQWSGLK